MSKSTFKFKGRLEGFDPTPFVSEFVTVEEVLDIKRAFDLFDFDGGGSIDPAGTNLSIQNSKNQSTRSVSKPKPKQYGT